MIIPAIDLLNKKIVRLYKGQYNNKINYHENTIDLIKKYKKQGAKIIHLIDLSGARNPKNKQLNILKEIILSSSIPIQIGGGIRNKENIKYFFNLGVKKIIIGSLAIQNPKMVTKWIKYYGNKKIILALDIIKDNNHLKKIMIYGWGTITKINLENIIEYFLPTGLKNILCTDINCDGTLKGPNIKLYMEITKKYPQINFQASGGVGSIKDILNLKKTSVSSIIIGRSLLEKKFTLREAIQCWQKE